MRLATADGGGCGSKGQSKCRPPPSWGAWRRVAGARAHRNSRCLTTNGNTKNGQMEAPRSSTAASEHRDGEYPRPTSRMRLNHAAPQRINANPDAIAERR